MGKSKDQIIKELRQFKQKVHAKYDVEKLILFGSTASGKQHKDSDIDLIVVSPFFRGKSRLSRSPPLYLEWDMAEPVDFLCYSPEEYEKLKNQHSIVNEAVKAGVEI